MTQLNPKQLSLNDGLEVILKNETDEQLDFVIQKHSDEIDKYDDCLLYLIPQEIAMGGLSEELMERYKCKYFIYSQTDEPIYNYFFRKWKAPDMRYVRIWTTHLFELILNAAVHGNKYDTDKKIFVTVNRHTDREKFPEFVRQTPSPALLGIKIRDEGDGFDWKDVMERLQKGMSVKKEGSDSGGHGIAGCFNSGIYLTWNEKGNEVKAYSMYI